MVLSGEMLSQVFTEVFRRVDGFDGFGKTEQEYGKGKEGGWRESKGKEGQGTVRF